MPTKPLTEDTVEYAAIEWLQSLGYDYLHGGTIAPGEPAAGLLHHSDRGSQYTSHPYRDLLEGRAVVVSMSRKGDCFDNAPVESFWATLKRECANSVFDSRAEARAVIFQYVMGFYNHKRRHSTLGYLSPHDFEMRSKRQILCT